MTCEAVNYITKANGHAWGKAFAASNIDALTQAVTGPLNLTGKTITGTFSYGDAPTLVYVASPASGITVTDAVNGLFRADLTWAQISPMEITNQVVFDFTVWNVDNTEALSAQLVFQVKLG